MSLSVGIVGLPNVGKSTLFNALLKKQQAFTANYPFATIEPNVGIVPVPDERLQKLADSIASLQNDNARPPIVPATVEFLDIAGLVAGAHKGEGLGNKFLSHIREVSAIVHVVRVFDDANIVREGAVSPKNDLEIIETELLMADLTTLEKQHKPKIVASREEKAKWEVVVKLKDAINSNTPARKVNLTQEEQVFAKELCLLTSKPILIILNISENDLVKADEIETNFAKNVNVSVDQVVAISAKIEEELAGLSDEESCEYLSQIGIDKTGLERLIKKAFSTLNLISFLTAGEKEVRAWTIEKGMTAPESAGVIHTDFEKNFIKAEIVSFDDFVEYNGWKLAREKGKVRLEGKSYIMQENDVVDFKVGV